MNGRDDEEMDAVIDKKQEFLDELRESVLEMQEIRRKRQKGDKDTTTSNSSFLEKMRQLASEEE